MQSTEHDAYGYPGVGAPHHFSEEAYISDFSSPLSTSPFSPKHRSSPPPSSPPLDCFAGRDFYKIDDPPDVLYPYPPVPGTLESWLNTPALDPSASPSSTNYSEYNTPPQSPCMFSSSPYRSPMKPTGLFPEPPEQLLCIPPASLAPAPNSIPVTSSVQIERTNSHMTDASTATDFASELDTTLRPGDPLPGIASKSYIQEPSSTYFNSSPTKHSSEVYHTAASVCSPGISVDRNLTVSPSGYTSNSSVPSDLGPTRRRHQRTASIHNSPYSRGTSTSNSSDAHPYAPVDDFSRALDEITKTHKEAQVTVPSSPTTGDHRRVLSGPAGTHRMKPGPRPRQKKSTQKDAASLPQDNMQPPLPENALHKISQYTELGVSRTRPPPIPNAFPKDPPSSPPPAPEILTPRPRRAAAKNRANYLEAVSDYDMSGTDSLFDEHFQNDDDDTWEPSKQSSGPEGLYNHNDPMLPGHLHGVLPAVPFMSEDTSGVPPSSDDPPQRVDRAVIETLYETILGHDDNSGHGDRKSSSGKQYICRFEQCGRTFPRKTAIVNHIQTHLDSRPYSCPHPDCGAAFVRHHDLRRHARTHSKTKSFQCPCGKSFARGDALMRHRQRGICSGSIVPRRTVSSGTTRRYGYT